MAGKDARPKEVNGWMLEGNRYVGPSRYIRPAKTEHKSNDGENKVTEDKGNENSTA